MESNIKASFIPDQMPATGRQVKPSAGGGSAGDIFILIAVVILAVALALAAGVFLYDRFLDSNIQGKTVQLERAQQAFEPKLVEELVRLDARLQSAGDVLARHLAPSELFNLLEELTLQSVSYQSLDYSINEDESITIRLQGKASSVNGVALQASVFGQHNAISNPIFTGLDIVSDGVTFEVTALVNPAAIRYTTIFSQYSSGIETSAIQPDEEDTIEEFGSFGGQEAEPNEITQ
ncbi:hypothetical protein COB18_02340 [Candidatus Kaiserbacteria bacterium]|nr:MAG: hypothetical protein COB18_02340 [Candidatus Kaiserbacteria bacterium]